MGADSKFIRYVERLVALKHDEGATEQFDEDVGSFSFFENLAKEDAIEDAELKRAIVLVSEHGDEALAMLNRVRNASVENAADADVELSTIHQFKGLEHESVRLLDDIQDCVEGQPPCPKKMSRNDLCALYTALTRVKSCLFLPWDLRTLWLSKHPPRPVLRCRDAGAADGWCGCCGQMRAQLAVENERARNLGLGVAPSHTTSGNACCRCAALGNLQPPLKLGNAEGDVPDGEIVAGWRLSPMPEAGLDLPN